MALKIFGDANTATAKPKNKFADDIVGRFRSGHQINKRPAALTEWRVTTGDPEVADAIHEWLGGDTPQEWEATGEDNLEVFTASKEVEVILEGVKSIRSRMVLWSRNGKLIEASDGAVLDFPEERKGEPDPDANLSFQERKQRARDGIGKEPQIEVYFRLKGQEDLGIFKFQTGSWSLASDMAYNDVEGALEDAIADSDEGKAVAVLGLEQVEFTAKNGPRAGQLVQYTKPTITIKGSL